MLPVQPPWALGSVPPRARLPPLRSVEPLGLPRRRPRPSAQSGSRRGDAGSRRGAGAQSPGVPVRRQPHSRGRALPPPLTRATGSSPLRRRPRAAEGRGQRQQIEELAWPRSGLRRQPPRPGRCSALARRPPRASRPPRPASARPPTSAARRGQPPAPGAPPWGPGSASGCCCCPLPSCSTRSAAEPLRRVVDVLAPAVGNVTARE